MCNKYYCYYTSIKSVLLVRLHLHLAFYNAVLPHLPDDVFLSCGYKGAALPGAVAGRASGLQLLSLAAI